MLKPVYLLPIPAVFLYLSYLKFQDYYSFGCNENTFTRYGGKRHLILCGEELLLTAILESLVAFLFIYFVILKGNKSSKK